MSGLKVVKVEYVGMEHERVRSLGQLIRPLD